MSIRLRAQGYVEMPTNAVLAPDTLYFHGSAWGAIAGDSTPARGNVESVLSVSVPTSTLTFDFDFPGTRLDSPVFARQLTGWQW